MPTNRACLAEMRRMTHDTEDLLDQAVPYGPITLRRGAAFEMA